MAKSEKSDEEVIIEKISRIISGVVEKEQKTIEDFMEIMNGREANISFKLDGVKFTFGKTELSLSGNADFTIATRKKRGK
ncbi:MAG: hypothetical protein PHW96_00745 [Candidatus Nanoarchaeia archaeon]|nr:hypothetical protein [Candidatus Nanoarchaeia archaeon]